MRTLKILQFPNRVTKNLLGMFSSTGNMKTIFDEMSTVAWNTSLYRGTISNLEITRFILWTAKFYISTVSTTMDELYRMDLILEMQGKSFVKQWQGIVSIYCLKYSTNFNRSEGSFPAFMVLLPE